MSESLMSKLDFLRSLPNLIVLGLVVSGVVILAWVGQITLNDMSVWNKDIGAILFGSRTGEAISLGVGMTLIYYLLIGVSLTAAGFVFFLRNRMLIAASQQTMLIPAQKVKTSKPVVNGNVNGKAPVNNHNLKNLNGVPNEERFFSGCIHHFGYLSSRPKDSPIPQECIICQRLGDCMVATVYIKKVNK